MSDRGFHLLTQQFDIPQLHISHASAALEVRVLWVAQDEQAGERSLLHHHPGLSFTTVHSLPEAATFLETDDFDAILATVPLPEGRIEVLLDLAHTYNVRTPVVVHAPGATLADAVRLTKLGAYY